MQIYKNQIKSGCLFCHCVFCQTRRKTAILRRVISMSIVLLFMGVWQGDFPYDVIYLKSSDSFSIKSSARYFTSIFSIP